MFAPAKADEYRMEEREDEARRRIALEGALGVHQLFGVLEPVPGMSTKQNHRHYASQCIMGAGQIIG